MTHDPARRAAQPSAHYAIAYGDACIRFSVRNLPRPQRRIVIHVMPDGSVQVDAPPDSDGQAIKHAVRRRARWIWQQLEAQRKRQQHILPREYVSGETHLYLGRRYLLKVQPTPQTPPGVRLWRGRLEVATPQRDPATVRRLLEAWYHERATEVFARLLADLAPRLNPRHAPPPWRLRSMRTRWGSCSPKGELLLNPHLIKAPKACIEYVIAHELCHLQEHNHSERFYRLLGGVLSDWKRRKEALESGAEGVLNG